MSNPKLNFKEETSAKKTRSPPEKAKAEQTQPKKKKLKLDTDKAKEKAQHLRFGKAELTPDDLRRLSKEQKREMYAAALARSAAHREIDQYEEDNVGVQALSEGEKAAGNVQDFSKSRYSRKLKKKAKMQAKKKAKTTKSSTHQPDKAQNAGDSSIPHGENSDGSSNWLSRWRQKQDIRKGYYAATRSGGTAAQTAGGKKAASSGASATRTGVEQVIDKGKSAVGTAINGLATAAKSNAHVLVIVGVFLLLILLVMSGFSSCGILFSGTTQVSGQTIYTAEDRDIKGAEADYKKLEKELDKKIKRTPADHPGYNEYQYHLDPIEHDPWQLTSFLTTLYRARTRFAKFFNLPELMSMFKEVADIKTSDQLHLPVPDAKFETVVVKPSETQKAMVQDLSRRAAEIHSGNVDASVDNMLCVTNDGRKIGLDVRLMNPMLPDDPDSKLNVCVRNVLKIWEEGKDQKLTQLLFCDLSTPKNDGNFNVYDDIRKKLIAAGVPESEIEFIHNADTEAKKAALFSKVRSGDVRVLLGSTAKMGAGTNVQQRLVAVHHLDVGWKPSDMTQRNGRIIRQGNMNKEVKVFNYVTEGTFDSYLFQTLENKQRFISQIMTSKSPMRSCDDVDEQALSYAEIKALCAGNPLIKEKMDLDVQVAKLKVLKADHQSQKFRLEDKLLTKFPAEIKEQTAKIAALKSDAEIAAAHPQDKENFCGMVIKGMTYDEKKTAGERLILACMELPNTEEQVVGSYRGFEVSLRFDTFCNEHQALLKGTLKYPVSLGSDPHGNIVRLDNALSNFADRITAAENELDTLKQQQAAAQVEVAKPFPQEEELAQKSARLAELNAQLDVDEKHHEPEQDAPKKEDAPRRSVLAALEEKAEKAEPVKPFKSYLDKDGDAR